MKKILLVVLCLLAGRTFGTHIVGGEFELIHKGIDPFSGLHKFQLSLILYFDNINGAPGAKDSSAFVRIYRKSDNMWMQNQEFVLNKVLETRVKYKRPQCSNGGFISTDRFYYTYNQGDGLIYLDPDIYNDPEGYYIVWERCCRNYTISNIFSEDPETGPYAGQTFYLEFPPLQMNGQDFINSSPTLFPPLSDYACKNRLYQVDFRGTDADGDSLVYSMSVPLNTHQGVPVPVAQPAPYPEVTYRSPFSVDAPMLGNPELSISKSGMLSVMPTQSGLFVFAVKCEEFRNGLKIGEVRRDFQMLVLVNCPVSNPPVVEGKRKNESNFTRNNLTASFPHGTPDEERCIDIRVSDPDASSQEESIEILAVAVSFENEDINEILPEVPTATLKDGSSAEFSVCFPECPYTEEPYIIDIVVLNDACGGAWTDTLRVTVDLEAPPNSRPEFTPDSITAVVKEGGAPYVVQFVAEDNDGDDLTLVPPAVSALDMAKYGFSYQVTSDVPGKVTATLQWNTECDLYDFSKKRQFKFYFQVNDIDKCDVTPNDTLFFDLTRQIDDFHDPVIEYVPDPTLEKVTITRKIYESVDFDVHAFDVDNDLLTLSAEGDEFSLPAYGAVFPMQTFVGEKTAPFSWYLDCSKIDLNEQDEFHFYMMVRDKNNICNYDLADTLDVTVKVLPPDNIPPVITLDGSESDIEVEMLVNQDLVIPVLGTDGDTAPKDMLTLEMLPSTNEDAEGFTFTANNSPGQSPVSGVFSWKPTCAIYRTFVEDYNREFEFRFRVQDDRCFTEQAEDIITLKLKVKDLENTPDEFLPPNVITPRDDNDKNEYFAMEKMIDGELVSILPPDNCQGTFVAITIVNRWGRRVYESSDKNFRWFAESEPAGMYFYLLQYSNREYKGIISVLTGDSESGNR
jgi:hypothetical protein